MSIYSDKDELKRCPELLELPSCGHGDGYIYYGTPVEIIDDGEIHDGYTNGFLIVFAVVSFSQVVLGVFLLLCKDCGASIDIVEICRRCKKGHIL